MADERVRVGLTSSKFKDLQNVDTRKAYSKVGCDLVCWCLGVITGQITEFKTSFDQATSDTGIEFLSALQTTSTDDQDGALQRFLFAIFSQKRVGEAIKYEFLPFSFLTLYSFTGEGVLRPCNMFSQYFSKTIFFARGAIFNRIMSDCVQEKKGFFE